MDTTGTPGSRRKLSSGKTIGIRSPELREKLDALLVELSQQDANLGLSDLLRDGALAFWPQIEAFHRGRRTSNLVSPADVIKAVQIVTKALEDGLTIAQLEERINEGLEASLATHD